MARPKKAVNLDKAGGSGENLPVVRRFEVTTGGADHFDVFEKNAAQFMESVFDSASRAGPGGEGFDNEVFLRLLDKIPVVKKDSRQDGDLSGREMKMMAVKLEEFLNGKVSRVTTKVMAVQ